MSYAGFQEVLSCVGKDRDDALLPKIQKLLKTNPRGGADLLRAVYSFPKEQQPKLLKMLAGISS
jgi:hypothetical protein